MHCGSADSKLSVILPTALCQSRHGFVFLWILANVTRHCIASGDYFDYTVNSAAYGTSCSHLSLFLSYHGDGDPNSEAEGEVLSVGDAAFANRQAVPRGETGLRHYCLCWGGELSYLYNLMLLPKEVKKCLRKVLCLMCLSCFDSTDWRGLRSQRGCWLGKRVSAHLCSLKGGTIGPQHSVRSHLCWNGAFTLCEIHSLPASQLRKHMPFLAFITDTLFSISTTSQLSPW